MVGRGDDALQRRSLQAQVGQNLTQRRALQVVGSLAPIARVSWLMVVNDVVQRQPHDAAFNKNHFPGIGQDFIDTIGIVGVVGANTALTLCGVTNLVTAFADHALDFFHLRVGCAEDEDFCHDNFLSKLNLLRCSERLKASQPCGVALRNPWS